MTTAQPMLSRWKLACLCAVSGTGQLGTKGSQLLGRYMIAMTLNAAYARFAIPKNEWTPAFLVIDEFQDYADEEKTPELLRLAREFKLGVTIAHQTMHAKELSIDLRTAISTNTSIKYSSSPEGMDINYMARDLRCEPSFLARQTKTPTEARFACYVRGLGLQTAFATSVPFGAIEKAKKMPPEALQRLLQRKPRKRDSARRSLSGSYAASTNYPALSPRNSA